MIKHKILLDNAPSVVGQQIHINHIDCEAGVDTKRRLYIKREATAIVAYCHHCNQKGFVKHGDDRLSTWINKPAAAATSNTKPVIASLTTEGKVWLHSHYCDTTNSSFNGIAGERHKVALTLNDTDNQPIGWQIRNLAPNATPKYTTHYTNSSSKGDAAWFKGNNTLVITEDYLSAWRVNYDTGYTSVALLRTALSDKTLRQIHDLNFEYVVIWLDPDEAGVQGAAKAYKKLNHFLPSTTKIIVLGIDKEPKQCTPAELESILI
jgi:hypothetical protein